MKTKGEIYYPPRKRRHGGEGKRFKRKKRLKQVSIPGQEGKKESMGGRRLSHQKTTRFFT